MFFGHLYRRADGRGFASNVCGGHARLRSSSAFEHANDRSWSIETESLFREEESPRFIEGRSQTTEHERARTRNEGTRSHRTLGLRTAPRERVQQVDPVRFDGTGPGDIAHWQNPTRSRRRKKGHRPDRPEACRNGNGSIWHRPRPSDTKCEVSMYMSAPLRSRKDDRH